MSVGAYVLVVIGTAGLLAGEYAFDWGRASTLAFAAMNVVGLVGIGFALFGTNTDGGA